MINRKLILKGELYGSSFMASIVKNRYRDYKENCVKIVDSNEKIEWGYSAYIFRNIDENSKKLLLEQKIPFILVAESFDNFIDYDVIVVNAEGIINIIYRADSLDNVIFITNECNSNCIMCPDSENRRKFNNAPTIDNIEMLIELIPDDTPNLCITGGEPTLIKHNLINIFKKCNDKFYNTSFLILTNGRTLSIGSYAKEFIQNIPKNAFVGIPIYSDIPEIHNYITQTKDGFAQSIQGIKNIMESINVEIRVVIMKENYTRLYNIAEMIIKVLPRVKKVSFMGMELLGNAAINKEKLWIDFLKASPYIAKASKLLALNGIIPQVYNIPLCQLEKELWSISVQSISDYKVRYRDVCDECIVKSNCGGSFFSTINFNELKMKPIKE